MADEPYGYLWYDKNMERRFTHVLPGAGTLVMNPVEVYTKPQAKPVTRNDVLEEAARAIESAPYLSPDSGEARWGRSCAKFIRRLMTTTGN